VYTPTTLSADARNRVVFSSDTHHWTAQRTGGRSSEWERHISRERAATADRSRLTDRCASVPPDDGAGRINIGSDRVRSRRRALYLPSSTTVATTITQESPTIAVRNATTTARRGSTVAVSGRITVDDVAVSNTSVALYLGERQVAETRTDGDAEYRLRTELPANISTGSQTFSIRTGDADTALASVSENADVYRRRDRHKTHAIGRSKGGERSLFRPTANSGGDRREQTKTCRCLSTTDNNRLVQRRARTGTTKCRLTSRSQQRRPIPYRSRQISTEPEQISIQRV